MGRLERVVQRPARLRYDAVARHRVVVDWTLSSSGPLPEPQTAAQGAAALRGSWFSVHVRERGGATVGLGRVIGDGGWYFHIADMAVLPEHQRRGIGNAILTSLIERIRRVAPPDPRWHLLADPPGQRLPGRHGFVPTAPPSAGMKLARR